MCNEAARNGGWAQIGFTFVQTPHGRCRRSFAGAPNFTIPDTQAITDKRRTMSEWLEILASKRAIVHPLCSLVH